jgi:hypothetical protein
MAIYVYSFTNIPMWRKVGYSKNLDRVGRRIREQLIQLPRQAGWKLEYKTDANGISDRLVHKMLVEDGFNRQGEWFDAPLDAVIDCIASCNGGKPLHGYWPSSSLESIYFPPEKRLKAAQWREFGEEAYVSRF